MCRFKSGIILKSKVIIAPEENESHSDLLESLGITDDYLGATKKFVRAELIPLNGEWWISPEEHPDNWNFVVDQKIDELSSGFYRLKRCEVRRLCNDVRVMLGSSRVGEMWGSSQVGEMRGSSQVGEMWGSSIAIDFKKYPNVNIMVSPERKFEMTIFENKES